MQQKIHQKLKEIESSTKPTAIVWGGETTVKIKGSGLGGRNQELALIVAELAHQDPIRKSWTFLSGGTDGRDGPTEEPGLLLIKKHVNVFLKKVTKFTIS